MWSKKGYFASMAAYFFRKSLAWGNGSRSEGEQDVIPRRRYASVDVGNVIAL
jgi:hypothetical protein